MKERGGEGAGTNATRKNKLHEKSKSKNWGQRDIRSTMTRNIQRANAQQLKR